MFLQNLFVYLLPVSLLIIRDELLHKELLNLYAAHATLGDVRAELEAVIPILQTLEQVPFSD
jgi:hypothetical protein